jgi:uncharacterized protein (DUF952 family)
MNPAARRRIYRLTDTATWTEAERTGTFASPDLAAEGFIHFSERHQVAGTANRYYADRTELLLLEVDEDRLVARVVRENTTGGTELFPHVYGPVPVTAVVRTWPLRSGTDGRFRLPSDLIDEKDGSSRP